VTDIDIIQGIDLSKWQTGIDWDRVAAGPTRFVWVKATEGEGYDDPMLRSHLVGARSRGLDAGVYHFARPDSDPITSAAHHCQDVRRLCEFGPISLTLPHALDLESAPKSMSPTQIVDWAVEWLRETQITTNQVPIVYSYRSFVSERIAPATGAERIAQYPLWLASYPCESDSDTHETIRTSATGLDTTSRRPLAWTAFGRALPWAGPHVWQWTGRGRVDGIPGDVDRNVTTRANLASLRNARG
jgi:GH25 family lysozyme M1 (1,4-beta-N-acetylmuramidase)